MADPRFSSRERHPQEGSQSIIQPNFPKNLHENQDTLDEKGHVSKASRERPPYSWILKHSESASVYESKHAVWLVLEGLGRSWKVFLDDAPNQNIYYVNVDGLRRPSETIQNLILMHKLIRNHSVFLLTPLLLGNCERISRQLTVRHARPQ